MDSRLVSIIIPVFNAEEYLSNTLDDLLMQTYENIEIIVVNDGSKDRSGEIIQQYKMLDERIKSIDVDNGGPSKARNIGLKYVKGEYIRFVDADDRIPKNSIKRMVEIFEKNEDADLVIGNYTCVPEQGYFLGNNLKSGSISSEEFIDIFINNVKSFYIGVPWNKLYRTSIVKEKNVKFNEKIVWCEDFIFNIEYYKLCNKIYILNDFESIYIYYFRSNGITSTLSECKSEEMKEIDVLRYKKAKEYCKQYQRDKEFELEWQYTDLYDQLSFIAKNISFIKIKSSYGEFKEKLSELEAYQYICMKANTPNSYIWKMLKMVIETKRYKIAFSVFVLKGCFMKSLGGVAKKMKRIVQPVLPKSL